MQTRTLSILIGLSCLGVAAGIAMFSQDSLAVAVPPGAAAAEPPATDAPADPGAGEAGPDDRGTAPAVASDAVFKPSTGAAAEAAPTVRTDTSGWTSGVVRGDIQLSVAALEQLKSITVYVEEARSHYADDGSFQRPKKLIHQVEIGRGTPTFEVTGVPFSEYPYVVTAYSPELNGTQRTVVVNEQNPLVEDVVLTITPGAPFSILLRDQDGGPHAGVDVVMLPIEQPHGRSKLHGTTDNFGSVVFDRVLAGPYELIATLQGQPFGDKERITVQPGNRAFQSKIQGQGHVMTVPRGVALNLQLHDVRGYGVGDAKVTATQTDRVRLTERSTVSDGIGRAVFPHLTPGVWQVTVELDGFQRIDQQVTIQADQEPQYREIRLVRTR
jgi:hypothetical protein